MLIDNNFYIRQIQEKYPRIAVGICAIWGEKELPKYLDKLLNDTRDGKRVGFPYDIFDSLQQLKELHDSEFPWLTPPNRHIWSKDDQI